jgi:hypothetical protein
MTQRSLPLLDDGPAEAPVPIAATRALARARLVRAEAAPASPFGFEPRHVPQLLPEDLYGPVLRGLCAGLPDHVGRTHAALCLARFAGAASWREAGAAIGLDEARARAVVANAEPALAEAGARERFWTELGVLAARYGTRDLVDYAARRRLLAALVIPPADWERLEAEAGVPRRRGDTRRLNASAWLWAELTLQPWQDAPAFGGRAAETRRKLYARFVARLLPQLRGPLLAYGATLLERRPLRLVE